MKEVSRFEDLYPDKENAIKGVEEIPAEEEIVILEALSSKTPSPTRQIWKPKVHLESNPAQDTTLVELSDAPLNH